MTGSLELHAVSKRFPGVLALDSVSLRVLPGEVHAVMGENGAGKSTLMKIAAGIHTPDSGSIVLDGQSLTFRGPHDAALAGISTVFQELTVLENRDVAHNVMVGREPVRMGGLLVDRKSLYRQAQAVLDRLGIDLSAETPVASLSAGERQMIEIARACAVNPKVLILDEPTSSLGREEELVLFALIDRLRGQGTSIIYITHRMSEVFQLADRITVLRDGRRIATGPTGDFSKDSLIKAMVGRDVPERRHGVTLDNLPIALEAADLGRRGHVKNATFTLHAGEVLGVAGLMGAGRTELARLLAGIDRPDHGHMRLFGEEFAPSGVKDAATRGVAYVSEDRKQLGLLLSLTVADNIALPALRRFSGLGGLLSFTKLRAFARKWMEELGVKAKTPDTVVNTLSGGNQQKVVLAKWLSTEPRVLLLDEPTRGVDVGAKAEIHQRIRNLADSGVAVLAISSELPEVLAISDRILVMAQGRIAGIVNAEDATEESLLELAFSEMGADAA